MPTTRTWLDGVHRLRCKGPGNTACSVQRAHKRCLRPLDLADGAIQVCRKRTPVLADGVTRPCDAGDLNPLANHTLWQQACNKGFSRLITGRLSGAAPQLHCAKLLLCVCFTPQPIPARARLTHSCPLLMDGTTPVHAPIALLQQLHLDACHDGKVP